MQNEWFFKWHHIGGDRIVEIDNFDGRKIRYGGLAFAGTTRAVYWTTIQRYLRTKVASLFDELEYELQKYPVDMRRKTLNEALGLIRQFAGKIRHATAEKDRILRGNGLKFPPSQDLGNWSGARGEDIEARVEGQNTLRLGSRSKGGICAPPHAQ